MQCPACGSSTIATNNGTRTIQAPFGSVQTFTQNIKECLTCLSQGFEDDDAIDDAFDRSIKDSVPIMLDRLSMWKDPYIERVLGLPFETLKYWRSGKLLSSAGIALLRILATYPWILGVADEEFDAEAAREALALAAKNDKDCES